MGSVLPTSTPKGYPGKRYYGGCEFVDIAEAHRHRSAPSSSSAPTMPTFSPIRARRPTRRSTSPCCNPGDPVLGAQTGPRRSPDATACSLNSSGKLYDFHHYGVGPGNRAHRLRRGASAWLEQRSPKLIVAGASAYPRFWDFAAAARHCRPGGRTADDGHGACRRPGRSGAAPRPRALLRCRHDYHAQDPARPARRLDPLSRQSWPRRSTRPFSPARRAAR